MKLTIELYAGVLRDGLIDFVKADQNIKTLFMDKGFLVLSNSKQEIELPIIRITKKSKINVPIKIAYYNDATRNFYRLAHQMALIYGDKLILTLLMDAKKIMVLIQPYAISRID